MATHFPREDAPARIRAERSRIEPLSAVSYRVEFTASAELRRKLERARELLSHSVPSGDLAQVFERALDCLIEKETRRRVGAGRARVRSRRPLRLGSRYVPVTVARAVWERDGNQCTFVDAEGRRCSERRLLTLEHRVPFALGGAATVENLCVLCRAHNGHTARRVYGAEFIARKRAERALLRTDGESEAQPCATRGSRVEQCTSPPVTNAQSKVSASTAAAGAGCVDAARSCRSVARRRRDADADTGAATEVVRKARAALVHLGFRAREVAQVLDRLGGERPSRNAEQLLRVAVLQLTSPHA
ncbi:MAG: hypothetical protein QM756_45415 [Polyangiaceae bacterium]